MAEPPSLTDTSLLGCATGLFESSSGSDGGYPFDTNMEGYDYEFVPAPDSRYECAICLLVLREPRQTPCGHRFCRDCISKWLRESHTRCPVDNEEIFEADLFADNFAKREIQNFIVRCPNSKQGCDITTSVKQMPAHLNDCPLALVPCPNRCSNVLLKRDLKEHVKYTCDLRQVECTDCNTKVVAKDFETHVQVCPEGRVTCQYCQEEMTRQTLPSHEEQFCPQKEIECTFSALGCNVQVARCKMTSHLQDSMSSHLTLVGQGVTRLFSHLNLSPLPGESLPVPVQQMSHTLISGLELCHLSQDSGRGSQQFVPDARFQAQENPASLGPAASGFKSLTPSGSLDSSSQSVQVSRSRVRRSPSDPKHFMSTSTQEASVINYASGILGEEANMSPASLSLTRWQDSSSKSFSTWEDEQKLVMHDQTLVELRAKMETMEKNFKQKLKTLEQTLSEMEGRMCNGQFFWKIRNYSTYQLEAEHGETTALHSQPFYTSPSGGYKLCMRANLNGVDSARGSHLSVFIHFMQGDYDDVLEWPFNGRIVLSVIDQNDCCELRNHVSETLMAKPNLAAFQRPITPRNHKGFGYMEFLPLSALKHSSYIKNDTLIIKAQVLPNS